MQSNILNKKSNNFNDSFSSHSQDEEKQPSDNITRNNSNLYTNNYSNKNKARFNVLSSLQNHNKNLKNNCNDNSPNVIKTIDSVTNQNNLDKKYDLKSLKSNIRSQNKLLEEYTKWINKLLTLINNKDNLYNDSGTPIQEGLAEIEQIRNENFEIKSLIIQTKLKNDLLNKNLEKRKKIQNMLIREYNEKETEKTSLINKENEQLNLNLQLLANEVDELNENDRMVFEKIQSDENLKELFKLQSTKKELIEENKLQKRILAFKKRQTWYNKIGVNSTDNLKEEMKKYVNLNFDTIGTLSGFGEYQLEKEENVGNKNFFLCGL